MLKHVTRRGFSAGRVWAAAGSARAKVMAAMRLSAVERDMPVTIQRLSVNCSRVPLTLPVKDKIVDILMAKHGFGVTLLTGGSIRFTGKATHDSSIRTQSPL